MEHLHYVQRAQDALEDANHDQGQRLDPDERYQVIRKQIRELLKQLLDLLRLVAFEAHGKVVLHFLLPLVLILDQAPLDHDEGHEASEQDLQQDRYDSEIVYGPSLEHDELDHEHDEDQALENRLDDEVDKADVLHRLGVVEDVFDFGGLDVGAGIIGLGLELHLALAE